MQYLHLSFALELYTKVPFNLQSVEGQIFKIDIDDMILIYSSGFLCI